MIWPHLNEVKLAILIIGSCIIYIGLLFILIDKSKNLVKFLKLDRGFDDEKIDLGNFNAVHIVQTCSIVYGAYLLANNVPALLFYCFGTFAQEASHNGGGLGSLFNELSMIDYGNWLWSTIFSIVGYFLITKHKSIAGLLLKTKTKGNDSELLDQNLTDDRF